MGANLCQILQNIDLDEEIALYSCKYGKLSASSKSCDNLVVGSAGLGMSRVDKIIEYWFGKVGSENYESFRPWWFAASADTDLQLRDLFAQDYEFAAAGYLDGWQGWSHSCLALILLLDQLPRNLFRQTAAAFATDAQALAVARQAIQNGIDREFLPVQRWFFYLPFEHSEDLTDQETSLALFASLPEHPHKSLAVASAQQHYQLIREFGRFPHRNAVLDRPSTAAELIYLQQPTAFHG
jgi:uncharacterized protein (DUF924 family)